MRNQAVSQNYIILDNPTEDHTSHAWHFLSVAQRQDIAFHALLESMHRGQPREDFSVLGQAIKYTGLHEPSMLEIGCGSGYYCEVLDFLLGYPVQYTGLDYSFAMITLAHSHYPQRPFFVGDAVGLPFVAASYDIVINGTALMHVPDYHSAIKEACRVARYWCIFHTVPVLHKRPTTILRKDAYGQPTIEVIFNENELIRQLEEAGLSIELVLPSIPYDLEHILQEYTSTITVVCKVKA